MYICDGGEDLCSNTLTSSPINLPPGPFTEDFVFDFVNDFPHYPDDAPCFKRLFCLKQTTKRILTLEMFSYTIPPERRSGLKFCPSSSTGADITRGVAALSILASAIKSK
jgi:hypothetical protein